MSSEKKEFKVGDIIREPDKIDPSECKEILPRIQYFGLEGEIVGITLERHKEALAEKDKEIAKRQKYCEDARDMLKEMRERLAKDLVLIQEGRRLLKEKGAENDCLHQELSENYVNMEKEEGYLQKIKAQEGEIAELKAARNEWAISAEE